MKFRSFFLLASALSLLGAGCYISKPNPLQSPTQALTGDTVALQYGESQGLKEAEVAAPTSVPTSTNPSPTPEIKKPMALAFPGVMDATEVNKKVRIKTTLGDIVIQVDHAAGPNAASNFVYLVKNGFYNGTIFHRVIPGFMIQGGDPTGTGRSGPGYQFDNDPVNGSYDKGIVAMANAGRNTNGSQFFIMVDNVPLPGDYSIFGKIMEGQNVADAIAATPRNSEDRPNTEVKMISVTIE